MPEARRGRVGSGEVGDGQRALGQDGNAGLGAAAIEFLGDSGGNVVAGRQVTGAHDFVGE